MTTTHTLIACRECDCLQREVPLPPGGVAQCARCGALLYRNKPACIAHTIAFFAAAAILFVVANLHPVLSLDAQGIETTTTLLGAARALNHAGYTSLGIVVVMTTIVFPAVEIAAMLYMLVSLHRGVVPRGLTLAFRAVEAVRPWGMIEVFMVGTLVSLVRLTHIATVIPGVGLYALGGVIVMLAAAESAYEPRVVWARVAELRR
jgi:paraquat-inducible protein A